ncbi:MAG: DUF192 domain-containing protein [Candidatus Falkowbacteria bacterium]
MSKWFCLLLSVIFLAGCVATPQFNEIIVNQRPIKVELALTPQEQFQGLSGRDGLAADSGMLFIFSKPGVNQFVMREMKFPLDIIWFNHNKIIYIAKNLPPEGKDYKNIYGPNAEANAVLEVNAGTSDKYGWQIGQSGEIKYEQ